MSKKNSKTPKPLDDKFVLDAQMIIHETWLTTEDVMAYLEISRSTVYRLRKTKNLPAFKLGSSIVYPKSLISKIMLQNIISKLKVIDRH